MTWRRQLPEWVNPENRLQFKIGVLSSVAAAGLIGLLSYAIAEISSSETSDTEDATQSESTAEDEPTEIITDTILPAGSDKIESVTSEVPGESGSEESARATSTTTPGLSATTSSCSRTPAVLIEQPADIEVNFTQDDCPFITGEVFGPGQRHDYVVELAEGQRLSIIADVIGGGNDLSASVIDPRGNVVASDDALTQYGSLEAVAVGNPPGRYTIRIEVRDSSTGDPYRLHLYDVTVAAESTSSVTWPENTCTRSPAVLIEQPADIEVNFTQDDCPFITGEVFGPGQRHDYVVELAEGQRLSIIADVIGGGNDLSASVIDPRGNVVASDDALTQYGSLEAVAVGNPPGRYTIRIEVRDSSTGDPYRLHLYDVT